MRKRFYHDMDAEPVNGLSVEAVHTAVKKAAEKARKGVPSLLEFVTYRYRGHSISDPGTYRTKEEVSTYKEADPIIKLEKLMLEKNIADKTALDSIAKKIKHSITEAIKFSEESCFPDPKTVYDYVYKQKNYPFSSN